MPVFHEDVLFLRWLSHVEHDSAHLGEHDGAHAALSVSSAALPRGKEHVGDDGTDSDNDDDDERIRGLLRSIEAQAQRLISATNIALGTADTMRGLEQKLVVMDAELAACHISPDPWDVSGDSKPEAPSIPEGEEEKAWSSAEEEVLSSTEEDAQSSSSWPDDWDGESTVSYASLVNHYVELRIEALVCLRQQEDRLESLYSVGLGRRLDTAGAGARAHEARLAQLDDSMAELDRLKEYHYRALRECERAGCWMTRDVYVEFNEEDVLALHDAIRDLDREIEAFTWERGLPAWEIWADGDDDCLERLFC